MKEKLFLIIIVILLSAILFINFYKPQTKTKESIPLVKGAFDSLESYDLSKKIDILPKKTDGFYEPKNIWAKNYILIDSFSGTILAAKNEHEQVSIASTTKIMTAIIALENYDINEEITIKDRNISSEESAIGLVAGDKLRVYDLLAALLISSANDAGYALADHIGFENFMQKMNEKVSYLGLKNSIYKDPAGYSDEGKSSAYDLAYTTKYALLNKSFQKIINTTELDIISSNGILYHLENSNRLIKPSHPLYLPSALGGKTGFTYEAGHCLVSAAKKNNNTIISVILDTDEDTSEASAKESYKLLQWGFDNYIWNN